MPSQLRCLALAAAVSISAIGAAQKGKLYLSNFTGQSVIVFGSSDSRIARGVGITYSWGDVARLRRGDHHGELLTEAYYEYSNSHGIKAAPPNSSSAFGVLAYARYRWLPRVAPNSFFDIGWGFQVSSRVTHDLESKINSTPFFDFGIIVGKEHERGFVGARFMHVSNANTVGDNQGQNHIYLLVQIPF